jgi:hypothetical protein
MGKCQVVFTSKVMELCDWKRGKVVLSLERAEVSPGFQELHKIADQKQAVTQLRPP